MKLHECLENMKNVQSCLIDYIECEGDYDQNYQNIIGIIEKFKSNDDFESFLCLLINIANNHHRTIDFFERISKILLFLKNDIKSKFSNFHIFDLFKSNKRLLLFLIEEGIVTIDKGMANIITTDKYKEKKYPQYFYPEIKQFLHRSKIETISKEIPENFKDQRKDGTSGNYVHDLIQKDLVEEFISFVHQSNYSLTATIEPTIFETNSFLLKNKPTLIQMSAFYGSIQIFKYLMMNKVQLDSSLWNYAVYGQNADIIHLLEEHEIDPKDQNYIECIETAIKCHHNAIKNYIHDNLYEKPKNPQEDEVKMCQKYLKYHNFEYITDDLINENHFYEFCKYNYPSILKSSEMNLQSILFQFFQYHLKFQCFKYNFIKKFFHEILKLNFNSIYN